MSEGVKRCVRNFIRDPKGKDHVEDSRHRSEGNIKMHLKLGGRVEPGFVWLKTGSICGLL